MNTVSRAWIGIAVGLVLLATTGRERTGLAQQSESAAGRFLRDHGVRDVAPAVREALDVFLEAQSDYRRGQYGRASGRLEAFWKAHPAGTKEWGGLSRTGYDLGREKGVFLGTPPCYYALRMLTDAVQWRVREQPHNGDAKRPAPAAVTLRVVLVGHARGIQPRSRAEFDANRGVPVALDLEPALSADDYRIIRQSLWLFGEYVAAITDGRLALRVEFLPLPQVTVPVSVSTDRNGHLLAGLADGAKEHVWKSIPEPVKSRTDWWWILYPSVVPERYADFASTEFVTGGMGGGPDGASPCFVIDDRWLTRKPPHLSHGPFTDTEREAYLPQWLQHEFFHHLFGTYPEFGLEKTSHQWFDHKTWPEDFRGSIEPDYYAEAVHKRLIPRGQPPLYVELRHEAPDPSIVRRLSLRSLEGLYRHEPMENDWHEGRITREAPAGPEGGPTYRWTNRAGKSWRLTYLPGSLSLRTGPDNPYAQSGREALHRFLVVLKRDDNGSYLPEAAGYRFDSALYRKVGP
jgi:hypothetical protein